MLKWIFRIVLLSAVVFGVRVGYRHVVAARAQAEAEKTMMSTLDALPPAERRPYAIAAYLSFYWHNVMLVPALCKHEGVDLAGYSQTFVQRYAADHDQARDAYQALGGNEFAIRGAVANNRSGATQFKNLLTRLGDESKSGSTADGCRMILENQAHVLDRMDFRKTAPAVWNAGGLH